MSMENHGGMISAKEKSWFVHQSSPEILPAESSSNKSGWSGRREWWILCTKYLSYSYGSLTCRKNLRHGTDDFTSPRKEGILWNFMALNNPSNCKHANHYTTDHDFPGFVALIVYYLTVDPTPTLQAGFVFFFVFLNVSYSRLESVFLQL
jgi:hypothetical protein